MENARRTKADPEFELQDTGIFDQNKYFDVFIEYAKAGTEDILIKITANNRGSDSASLNILPTIWFRNTWAWGYNNYTPEMFAIDDSVIEIRHNNMDQYRLYCENCKELLFCTNETNTSKLYNSVNDKKYHKDGINDFIIHQANTVDPDRGGTKASANYDITIPPNESIAIRLRLCNKKYEDAFADFDLVFKQRIAETNIFFNKYFKLQQKLRFILYIYIKTQIFRKIFVNLRGNSFIYTVLKNTKVSKRLV